mmetsp:Transcript_21249/g.25609  ORF Transcript_21249/g.25609 Transcript_21249/m.25609 type:complete len:135 (-) Transcript_21249:527-931(-)
MGSNVWKVSALILILSAVLVLLIPTAIFGLFDHILILVPLYILAIWLFVSLISQVWFVLSDVSHKQFTKIQWLQVTGLGVAICIGSPLSAAYSYSKESGLTIDYAKVEFGYIVAVFFFICAFSYFYNIAHRREM